MMTNFVQNWNVWWDDQLSSKTSFDRSELEAARRFPFLYTARSAQRPPKGTWRNWLFIGGRGAGKTRAGAEWARFSALRGGCRRIALVGPTLGDVREVMIEGPSGLRAIEPLLSKQPRFNVSRRRLEWDNGAVGLIFSAEDPDSLRGPQFDAAWCDEIAVWQNGEDVWSNLQFGLRLGAFPRCVSTTTPRPVPLVRRLIAGEAVVTHSATQDNQANLSAGFVEAMKQSYGGTALARQELGGELIEDIEGALWRRNDIDRNRVESVPSKLADVIVAIDPPVTSHSRSDSCGIIVAAAANVVGFESRCFVLADASMGAAQPLDWATRARSVADKFGASRIVAESNQGGEMVRTVLEKAGCDLPIDLVRARLGKRARAVPVAALYQRGQVAHVGEFDQLEDEMCLFGTQGLSKSPDRVDALVWAIDQLGISPVLSPSIRAL